MAHITIDMEGDLAAKFNKLLLFFGNTESLFNNFIEYHRRNLVRETARMRMDLEIYEHKYGMSSEVFYAQFDMGSLSDSKDFMLWAGIYEMFLESNTKLKALQ